MSIFQKTCRLVEFRNDCLLGRSGNFYNVRRHFGLLGAQTTSIAHNSHTD